MLAVAASWLLGFLPWILAGLDTERMTGGPFAPDQGLAGVRTPVPMAAEHTLELLFGAHLGALAAVLLSRVGGRSWRRALLVAGLVPVLAVVLGAWSARLVADQADGAFATDDRVLTGLQAVHVAGAVSGALLGLLVLAVPPAVRLVLLAAPALLLQSWVSAAWVAVAGFPETLVPTPPLLWVPSAVSAGVLGVVAGLCLRRWVDLWAVVPAVVLGFAVEAALPVLVLVEDRLRPGSGLGASGLGELTGLAADGMRSTLSSPDVHRWWVWTLAAVTAVVVRAVLTARSHRERPRADPDAG